MTEVELSTAAAGRVLEHVDDCDLVVRFAPGTQAEVWSPSTGRWAGGFEAVDLDIRGWKLRRADDGQLLAMRLDLDQARVREHP